MEEKGSIKNLYKAWRLFLEEKKKKKKNQNKRPSKIIVFFTTFFTFLLSPFFFEPNKSKNNKISKKQIELLIIEIEKENSTQVLLELKEELKEEHKKVKSEENKNVKKTIKKIDKAIKIIDAKIDELSLRKNVENNIIKNEVLEKNHENEIKVLNKNNYEEVKNIEKKEQRTFIKEKIVLNEDAPVTESKNEVFIDPDVLEFLNYMKLEINTIEYKLKSNLNIFQLKYLKSRIIELNYKRENFKDNYNFDEISKIYESKDKYHILKQNSVLESLYKSCDIKIKGIDKEKEIKKEKNRKKEKYENINLTEVKKINIFLKKEIQKQQLQVSKLKLLILSKEKKLRKPTLLSNIKNMLKNSLKLCVSLMPISLFKNKLVSGLASAFVLNNSIRSIRNLVNEEKLEYAKLLNSINNQKDCIFNTRLVYEDAITQIEFLKYDLLGKFSFTNLKDIFNKIYEIEEEIKIKNKVLSDLEIELEDVYDKTIEKTKKYVS